MPPIGQLLLLCQALEESRIKFSLVISTAKEDKIQCSIMNQGPITTTTSPNWTPDGLHLLHFKQGTASWQEVILSGTH